MTGYSDYLITREHGDNKIGSRRAIMKPFHPRELLLLVREVRDDADAAGDRPPLTENGVARRISNFE